MNMRRSMEFCERVGLKVPILLAPMAGACPPSLSIEVANAGGMGACGALLLHSQEMKNWAAEFRSGSSGLFQINLWIPEAAPTRDAEHEAQVRRFLERWGPPLPVEAGDIVLQDFDAQCKALLEIRPTAISSIMGLYPPDVARQAKARGILWFATATTIAEGKVAEAAGADAIIAQGMEAGGHRGAFDPVKAERELVGLMALIPALVDAVQVPVIAAGGIADGRGVAAALTLGASATMIGTGFLRCPEAKLHPAWAQALGETTPERTMISRAFSGRPGRTIATDYARAAAEQSAPAPAPYPVQRGLTSAMREQAQRAGDLQRMQVWAGQSAALARAEPARQVVQRIWSEAQALLH
jgi:nitronate monooxygenase